MILANILKPLFGSRNERLLKHYSKIVAKINALEPETKKLSLDAIKSKTQELKAQVNAGKSLEEILPEAFALVREAARRTLNMRHFDVQLIGGLSLHQGKIAEMRTGEGKTLSVTLPAYLNSLTGKGVHIVTVNDYLAKRDANWMLPIYEALGITVGVIVNGMERSQKQEAYNADVVYGTNNEFGFDYLRDNMAFATNERMQRGLNFAVVDEADSILIDEARTPLIISGSDEQSSELYTTVNKIIPKLKKQAEKDGPGDYYLDEKSKQAFLTEEGHQTIEELLLKSELLPIGTNLYDVNNIGLMHHVYAALRAHALFKKDVDYIVKDNQIIIVDEHTGRTMVGRRWSEGLHQAIEAKENVEIQSENQTLASITLQNYFRLYKKLAGTTGTADTEAYELQQIYGLEVVVIPTNQPVIRIDAGDQIYMTFEEKFAAIIQDIEDCAKRKQPVLVGTISIETSEYLANLLKKKNIAHQVLNAKYHESEAKIIAEAGRPGAVTIATNMAGRGTDIVLGGNINAEILELKANEPEVSDALLDEKRNEWEARHKAVLNAGGLRVIGTERHESRRIDNQLRGRCARQGDPGSTQFYLSVRDNLMRIFVSDNIAALLSRLGLEKGEAITHSWVNKAIENAQRKVEGHNFDVRKQLLEYDDVANEQRKVIYQQRNELMEANDISETIVMLQEDVLQAVMSEFIPPNSLHEDWNIDSLMRTLESEFGQKLPLDKWLEEDKNLAEDGLKAKILQHFKAVHDTKTQIIGALNMRHFEKAVMLNTVDALWKEHLATMDYMRQSIHLRGYAQKDPRQEYKREAFYLFSNLLENIKRDVIAILAKFQIQTNSTLENIDDALLSGPKNLEYKHADAESILAAPPNQGPNLGSGAKSNIGSNIGANIIESHDVNSIRSGARAASNSSKARANNTNTKMNNRINNRDSDDENVTTAPFVRDEPRVGRNDPCPCGSGRKYKQCHGVVA